jgi:uncharacterized protein YbjT (DUF2867 family)
MIHPSTPHSPRILVTGATGKQGGAVARHLLQAGFRVRGLTRNSESLAAKRLVDQGAEIVVGNLNDCASLRQALAGIDGVFSVQNFWEKGVGLEGEIQQGKNLADAAKQSGVKHYIQSSMAKGEHFQDIAHFASKAAIESYVMQIGLPYTIIGTVYFMDNVLDPKAGGSMTFPTLAGSLPADLPFYLLAVNDLGGVVTAIFQAGDRWIGQRVDIASDRLTIAQMKAIYQQTSGNAPKSWRLPNWMLSLINREFAQQLRWQKKIGWTFELDMVRSIYPNLTSFQQFLSQHKVVNL